jgi:hypothetical protein
VEGIEEDLFDKKIHESRWRERISLYDLFESVKKSQRDSDEDKDTEGEAVSLN